MNSGISATTEIVDIKLYAMAIAFCLSVHLFVCSFVCRLQRVLLLAAGAYRVGH